MTTKIPHRRPGQHMKNIELGSLSIPITQYASQGNAVLGIRDSGKTYSGTYLAEQLYAAKIPFIAFDPSGVWKFLRVPGKGAGLPIVVAGGKSPDLPLSPQSAPEIVRAAMKANVSLVIDLYDIHLSKADWGRIVESCIRVLLYENGEHGLRHVFIEEAAEFCPQQVSGDKARVYAEVEKLARIGGNALLGYTLINQRAEQVNKAVLELCDCLFLHRQKGKNSLASLAKWLDYSQGGNTKDIMKGLPTLPSGQCWVWPAGAEHATHVQMPAKETFHPDRRALIANPAVANVQRVDATAFVSELKSSLAAVVEEAKANDPKALRARIAELERERGKTFVTGATHPAVDLDKAVQAAEERGFNRGLAYGQNLANNIRVVLRGMVDANDKVVAGMESMLAQINGNDPGAKFVYEGTRAENPVRSGTHPVRSAPSPARPAPRARQIDARASSTNGSSSLGAAARKILGVLSQFPEGCNAGKIALLSGYRYSGSFQNALSGLRSAGCIEGANTDVMRITSMGEAHGPFQQLPQGQALIDHWLRHQSFGSAARKILTELVDRPRGATADELCKATGYNYSGSFQNALSELRTAGVLVGKNTGIMTASEELLA